VDGVVRVRVPMKPCDVPGAQMEGIDTDQLLNSGLKENGGHVESGGLGSLQAPSQPMVVGSSEDEVETDAVQAVQQTARQQVGECAAVGVFANAAREGMRGRGGKGRGGRGRARSLDVGVRQTTREVLGAPVAAGAEMFDLGLANSSQAGFLAGAARVKSKSPKSYNLLRRARIKSTLGASFPKKAVNVRSAGGRAGAVLPIGGLRVKSSRMNTSA
jgi:hypothetical protein